MLRTKGRRNKPQTTKTHYRVNWQIRIPEVRVIDENGQQLGVMPTNQALKLAEERELDLVEVFPTSVPPVCKILDFGQFQYQQNRRNQQAKANIKKVDTKGIRLSFKISDHDLEMRLGQAVKFLSKGDKVRVEMFLRGRERQYSQDALVKLNDFIGQLKSQAEIILEQEPKRLGNQLSAIIAPAKSNN